MDTAIPVTGQWRVIGASVVGVAHVRAGMPCQDAHRWETLPNGCLVVAIADGAGSAPQSAVGARNAVDTAVTHLTAALQNGLPSDEQAWHRTMAAAFDAAAASLAATAENAASAVRDYATTLTLVAALPDALVVGQIGDGIVVAAGDDGAFFLAVTPQRGEYANEVALLTMPDAAARMAFAYVPSGVRAFAATTDGILRLAVRLPSHEPHAPFFAPLVAFARESTDRDAAEAELAAFLASERVARRTDDDKTLVLAVRVEGSATNGATTNQTLDTPPDG